MPMVVPSVCCSDCQRTGFTGELIVAKGATTDAIIHAVEDWVWKSRWNMIKRNGGVRRTKEQVVFDWSVGADVISIWLCLCSVDLLGPYNARRYFPGKIKRYRIRLSLRTLNLPLYDKIGDKIK